MKPHPTHLDIDLSSKCNLRCSFCHLSFFDPKASTQLTHARFKEWVEPVLGHLASITLFSKFEPLVCRDFVPIFNEVCRHDVESYFSTNGILLNDEIIDAITGRLTYLTVSLTGFNPGDYQRHMGQDAFAKVVENLEALNAMKEKRGTPYPILRISTVAMSETFGDMTAAVDFAGAHKAAEGVQVTSLIAYSEKMIPEAPANDSVRFTAAANVAKRHAEAKGVKFTLQSGSLEENERITRDIGHKHCKVPWNRLSVQPNGDVFPCPVAYEPVGSLLESTLLEIWGSGPLERFRTGVNDPENMNEDCRACTHCRHRSVAAKEASDFSGVEKHYAGMTRK